MPKNLTKFNTSWLSRVDANNDPVDVWLKKGSISTTFKCSLCQTNDLTCGNQGWKAVEQHMNNSKHQHLLNQWKTNTKFTVSNQSTSSSIARATQAWSRQQSGWIDAPPEQIRLVPGHARWNSESHLAARGTSGRSSGLRPPRR